MFTPAVILPADRPGIGCTQLPFLKLYCLVCKVYNKRLPLHREMNANIHLLKVVYDS